LLGYIILYMIESDSRRWSKRGSGEKQDPDLTPNAKDRWFPEDEKPKPLGSHPFADRRLPDGTEVMHPVRGAVAAVLAALSANQTINDLPNIGRAMQEHLNADESIKLSSTCANHFSNVEEGFCITTQGRTLFLAQPMLGDEEEERRVLKERIAQLSPKSFTIAQDKKGTRWFISLTAKDDQQLADWAEYLENRQITARDAS